MSQPPEFLQRVPRPPLMVGILVVAGVMVTAFFVLPGMVALFEGATAGWAVEKAVRCEVLPTAPKPLPPGDPRSYVHALSLHLGFAGSDGGQQRAVDCRDAYSREHPLRITYEPSALGLPSTGAPAVTCSVGRPGPDGPGPAALVFVDEVGLREEVAVLCPGGATADRSLRIDYHPHQLGLRSRFDRSQEFADSPTPAFVIAAVMFAISGFFFAAVAYAWRKTRLVYVVLPLEPVAPATPVVARRRPWWQRFQRPPPLEEVLLEPTAGAAGGPSTTVGPTGPGSIFYAALPGLVVAALGSLLVIGALLDGDHLLAAGATAVLGAILVVLTWLLSRRGHRGGMVMTVSDDTLTLAKPGAEPVSVSRTDVGLVGIETYSTRSGYYWVVAVNLWRPDGHVLGSWAPAWPVGRSGRALRKALRRHGWPQAEQGSIWGDHLFGFDPGRDVTPQH